MAATSEFSSLTSTQSGATTSTINKDIPLEVLLDDSGRYDDYICTASKHLLQKPVQYRCGHRYCKSCIQQLISESIQSPERLVCLGCKADDDVGEYSVIDSGTENFYADQAKGRELRKLAVRCQNHARGCKWRGLLPKYSEHADRCEYSSIECTDCGEQIPRLHIAAHKAKHCPKRCVNCAFCSEEVVFSKMQEHAQSCLMGPKHCYWQQRVDVWKTAYGDWLFPQDINEETDSVECPLGCMSGSVVSMSPLTSIVKVVTSEDEAVDLYTSLTPEESSINPEEKLLEVIEELSCGPLSLGQRCQEHGFLSRFCFPTVQAVRILQQDGSRCVEASCANSVEPVELHKDSLVSCVLNKDQGQCAWRGGYKQVAAHLEEDHVCCYCTKRLADAAAAFKHPLECKKWRTLCLWCNEFVPRDELKEHRSWTGDCRWVLCTFGCHRLVRREDFEHHVDGEQTSHLIQTNSQLHRVALRTNKLIDYVSTRNHKELEQGSPTRDAKSERGSKLLQMEEPSPMDVHKGGRNTGDTAEAITKLLDEKLSVAKSKNDTYYEKLEETLSVLQHHQSELQTNFRESWERVESLEQAVESCSQNLVQLTSHVETLSSMTETTTERQGEVDGENTDEFLTMIHRYTTAISRDIKSLTQQVYDVEQLRRKLATQERLLLLKDVAIAELNLRVETLEQTSTDGTLLWRVNNVSRRLKEAKSGAVTSLFSPSFLSDPKGYKMCTRLYLNGDGSGKDSHVSLFFVIKRSVNDAFLTWPFSRRVTLKLLDPSSERQHYTDSFRPEPSSSSFVRPKTEMNVASGCPQFMPHARLPSFTQNDCIYIYVQVHKPDRPEANPFEQLRS